MKERPVIFNGEMVRAILDGRKTQTRRAISDRHLHLIDVASQVGECYPLESGIDHANSQSYYREYCPFGQVGDRLWVRETWTPESIDAEEGSYSPDYRATANGQPLDGRWTPAIHMPRNACRILLEITAVRVERLNDISEEDAIAEGLECYNDDGIVYYGSYGHGDCRPEIAFSDLWQSIYGEESWRANPWVWVIEFRRVEVEK